jgi:hypothetical protein
VSVEATSWALNLAPVPAYRGGQPSSACKFELVGLANHAGPDGVGAFRRWQRSSATPARPSARCAPAWTGWKPRASSGHATQTSSRPGSSAPTGAPRPTVVSRS